MEDVRSDELNALLEQVLQFHNQEIFQSVEQGISNKRRFFKLAFPLVRYLSKSRTFNLLLLGAIISGYRVFRYPSKRCDVFVFDPNGHNLRSIGRVNACLQDDIQARISINGEQPRMSDRLRGVSAFGSLWKAAGILKQCRPERALPHLQAVIAAATYLFYCSHPFREDMRVLCVANDHSPVCMALLFMARKREVKTVYIQHAPVTENFPPLSFELSILYDRASEKCYARAAARRGTFINSEIVFLPPFAEEFERPDLGVGPYKFGICLSYLPNSARIQGLIERLAAHPSVKSVVLRKHPRCAMDLSRLTRHSCVSLQPKGETADAFFDQVDVVLVPNSGVTIEALHRGCPTFFTPGADDIPDDYYGFVANGIVPEFRAELLDDRDAMLAFFDNAWKIRFGEQDETVHTPLEAARKTVSEAFMRLM